MSLQSFARAVRAWFRTPLAAVLLISSIIFVIEFGNALGDVPSLRLLQDIICAQHYGVPLADVPGSIGISSGGSGKAGGSQDGGSPHPSCSSSGPVQDELNVVSTGLTAVAFVPGIFVSLFFGSLADRWGPRPVLLLCAIGILLSNVLFLVICAAWTGGSIRAVWASCLPLFVGGGQSVAEAMVFAVVSVMSSAENRATHFQIVVSAVLLAETLAPFAAGAMMSSTSIWVPLILSPIIMGAGIAFLAVVVRRDVVNKSQTQTAVICPDSTSDASIIPIISNRRAGFINVLKTKFTAGRRSLGDIFAMFRQSPVVVSRLFPATACVNPLATVAIAIALRYLPSRYDIDFSSAGMILGLRTGMSILVLIVILPCLNRFVLVGPKFGFPSSSLRDLRIAQVSAGFLVVGLVVTAAAPQISVASLGLAVFTLGSGLPTLARAVLAEVVGEDKIGRLLAALAMVELLGFLVGALGLGAVFEVALKMGLGGAGDGRGAWLGLPFYVAAGLMLLVAVPMWTVSKVEGAGEMLDEEAA